MSKITFASEADLDKKLSEELKALEELIQKTNSADLAKKLSAALKDNNQEPNEEDKSKANTVFSKLSEASQGKLKTLVNQLDHKPTWMERISDQIQGFVGWLMGTKKIEDEQIKKMANGFKQIAELEKQREPLKAQDKIKALEAKVAALEQNTQNQEIENLTKDYTSNLTNKIIAQQNHDLEKQNQELITKNAILEKQNQELIAKNQTLEKAVPAPNTGIGNLQPPVLGGGNPPPLNPPPLTQNLGGGKPPSLSNLKQPPSLSNLKQPPSLSNLKQPPSLGGKKPQDEVQASGAVDTNALQNQISKLKKTEVQANPDQQAHKQGAAGVFDQIKQLSEGQGFKFKKAGESKPLTPEQIALNKRKEAEMEELRKFQKTLSDDLSPQDRKKAIDNFKKEQEAKSKEQENTHPRLAHAELLKQQIQNRFKAMHKSITKKSDSSDSESDWSDDEDEKPSKKNVKPTEINSEVSIPQNVINEAKELGNDIQSQQSQDPKQQESSLNKTNLYADVFKNKNVKPTEINSEVSISQDVIKKAKESVKIIKDNQSQESKQLSVKELTTRFNNKGGAIGK